MAKATGLSSQFLEVVSACWPSPLPCWVFLFTIKHPWCPCWTLVVFLHATPHLQVEEWGESSEMGLKPESRVPWCYTHGSAGRGQGGRKEEHGRWERLNETWRTPKLSQAKRDPGPSLPRICPRTPAPDWESWCHLPWWQPQRPERHQMTPT